MQNGTVNERYIYVMLSQTPTGFGKTIRKVMGYTYNHTSIAFDKELVQLYSFGRKVHKVPVVAGLVREYPERFSLNVTSDVPVRIYRIPVTQEQYDIGLSRIQEILDDEDEYLYNLYSVLLYPVFRGFSTFKAYHCTEFVAHLLQRMKVELHEDKPACGITPEGMKVLLQDYEICYEGNLLEYVSDLSEHRPVYFRSPNMKDGIATVYTLGRLVCRTGSGKKL